MPRTHVDTAILRAPLLSLRLLTRLLRPPACSSFRYFGACKQKGVVPAVDCAGAGTDGLENLRVILSTGSPLLPEHFQWIYEVCE